MSRQMIFDLADCTQFRQTLQSRPPAIVHGSVVLLVLLLTSAITWAGLSTANLVIRAPGRVRPIAAPARVFASLGSELNGRVAVVYFSEGDVVQAGQILVELETEQLENKIAKLEGSIATVHQELAEQQRLEQLVSSQYASSTAKAQAELTHVMQQIDRGQQERAALVIKAEAELEAAQDQLARYERLVSTRAISQEEFVESRTRLRQAEQNLKQSMLPVNDGQVKVTELSLESIEHDHALRLAEIDASRIDKQSQINALNKELANLELAREQSVLRSPVDGVIISEQIKPGDVLQPGKPVVEVAQQEGFLFEAAVPSDDVGELKVGTPVVIKFDAYDYQNYGTLAGTVGFIAPDSKVLEQGENKPPLPAYQVRISLTQDSVGLGHYQGRVKLGLGGTAEIVTGQETILAILFKKIRRTISLG